MKYFAEILVGLLIAATITFLYCLAQIVIALIQSMAISEFQLGFVMGFATSILIGLWILDKFTAAQPSMLNTSMSSTMDNIRRMF